MKPESNNQAEFGRSRGGRAAVARQTLEIVSRGTYQTSQGRLVSIEKECVESQRGTTVYSPDDFGSILERRDALLAEIPTRHLTTFETRNETTLAAAERLLAQAEVGRVLALNFASAKNPGGGFLNGSQAQEESLARSSGLYACLQQASSYYEANRRHPDSLYTDHMIYSPGVPVFRRDNHALLDQPYLVSFLTAPAPNAGAVHQNQRRLVSLIEPTLRGRIDKVLALAVVLGYDSLVLGAWGCGVFQNDPNRVASHFAEALASTYAGVFRRVAFAVFDTTPHQQVFYSFASRWPTP